jgi:hypothetical protein
MEPGMSVADIIASIEMHRRQMEKEPDLAASCNEALRKLHELLERERKALQLNGSGTHHSSNIEAVTTEIARVKGLVDPAIPAATSPTPRPGRHQVSLQNGARIFPRNKGRRTMGRGGR